MSGLGGDIRECRGCGRNPPACPLLPSSVLRGRFCGACLSKRHLLWRASNLMPGSRDKVELMRERNAVGLPVHHPDDLKMGSQRMDELQRLARMRELAMLEAGAATGDGEDG